MYVYTFHTNGGAISTHYFTTTESIRPLTCGPTPVPALDSTYGLVHGTRVGPHGTLGGSSSRH